MVELAPWIARRRRALAGAAAAVAAAAGTVPYLGRMLTLVPQPGRTRAHRRGDLLLVPAGDPAPALERYYRRAARPRSRRGSTPRCPRRHGLRRPDHPRPAHALGVLLGAGPDVVQLAPAARARGGPGLRGRARGLPPRGDGPLRALLGAARVPRARLARARRLAAPLRGGAAAARARRAATPRRASRRPPGPRPGGPPGRSTPPPRRPRARRVPRGSRARSARPGRRPAAAA